MSNHRPTIGVGALDLTAEAKRRVMQVLDNNRLSYGPVTREFEERFAGLHGCQFGLFTNSGTSALHIAVAALKEIHDWRDGDEVIVPAVTFVATVNVLLHNNLRPILVDVDSTYYELDPSLIEDACTDRTRAIIPVHLFGQPCDMDPILEVAGRRNLRLIEDSCETMFAKYRGRSVGNFGDVGCFSTYVAHLLTTGVGGLNTTNNPEYAVKLRSLANHGRDSIYMSIDDDDDVYGEQLRTIVERRFKFVTPGHSFRATEMEAALGVAQLEDYEVMIEQRRSNAAYLSRMLQPLEDRLQLPAIRPETEHSFMMYPLIVRDEPKEDFSLFLEGRGIETRDMLPLTNQPVYHRILGLTEADYPVADWINRHGLYIGCHQHLSASDLDYLVDVLHSYWKQPSRLDVTRSLLVVNAKDASADAVDILERLPLEAFDHAIMIGLDGTDPISNNLNADNLEVVDGSDSDPWTYLRGTSLTEDYDNIVTFSLDGRDDPGVVGKLLFSLERGNDMVVGSRFSVGSGGGPRTSSPARRTGNRIFTLLVNLVFSGNLTDSLSSLRGVRGRRLREAQMSGTGLVACYELSISAARSRWRIAEVETVEQVVGNTTETVRALGMVLPLLLILVKRVFVGGHDETHTTDLDSS